MAASSSGWSDSQKEEIIRIAENAIENITRLTDIVGRSSLPSDSSSSSGSLPSTNALQELQRRFPTVNSRGRNTTRGSPCYSRSTSAPSARAAPYNRRAPGRPTESPTVTKDVVVIEYGHDRVPSKAEKAELEKSKRVISGFEVSKDWSAKQLEKELTALLKGTQMEGFCFEIVKNCSGTLVPPNIPSGRRIDSKLLLKSIAPSGCVYIRLLAELPDDESDDMLSYSVFDYTANISTTGGINTSASATSTSTTNTVAASITVDQTDVGDASTTEASVSPVAASACNHEEHLIQCPFDISSIIDAANSQNLHDPVEVIRFLQEKIVTGRPLELTSCEETCEGATNFITVDRDRVLETTFSELEFIDNYRLTFKVDFMGEESVDQGGPRKEWIRLMNRQIKDKYFDNGLRHYLSKDYYYVGVMVGVAMLQNGQMPAFINDSILQEVLSPNKSGNPCVSEMQAGLEMLGILSALRQLPMLIHLLRPDSQHKINVPKLLQILKPKFSEEGSNALKHEKEVYQLFVRYVREVASGRRSCGERHLELCHILEFLTGASEEPVLGFGMDPSIEFVLPLTRNGQDSTVQAGEPSARVGFTPTAHTCANILSLPRATHEFQLPPQEKLFEMYDLAFSQPFFGKV